MISELSYDVYFYFQVGGAMNTKAFFGLVLMAMCVASEVSWADDGETAALKKIVAMQQAQIAQMKNEMPKYSEIFQGPCTSVSGGGDAPNCRYRLQLHKSGKLVTAYMQVNSGASVSGPSTASSNPAGLGINWPAAVDKSWRPSSPKPAVLGSYGNSLERTGDLYSCYADASIIGVYKRGIQISGNKAVLSAISRFVSNETTSVVSCSYFVD